MPDGVDEDPEPCLRLTWRTSGAKRLEFLLGLIRVIHADVEMQLLVMRRIRPARRDHSVTSWKASSRRPGSEPMTTQPSMSSLARIPSTWQ